MHIFVPSRPAIKERIARCKLIQLDVLQRTGRGPHLGFAVLHDQARLLYLQGICLGGWFPKDFELRTRYVRRLILRVLCLGERSVASRSSLFLVNTALDSICVHDASAIDAAAI